MIYELKEVGRKKMNKSKPIKLDLMLTMSVAQRLQAGVGVYKDADDNFGDFKAHTLLLAVQNYDQVTSLKNVLFSLEYYMNHYGVKFAKDIAPVIEDINAGVSRLEDLAKPYRESKEYIAQGDPKNKF